MADLFSIARSNRFQDHTQRTQLMEAPPAALTREQVVDEIISVNPSATADFLAQFDDTLLSKYLDHLRFTARPRCGKSAWDRPGDAPAIMVRRRVV
ncbi:MAG: hypothetical protein JJ974_10320 [Phycisphaerales bacterium]|nr:hypothetical protein [Phycisphaerales bacterium]